MTLAQEVASLAVLQLLNAALVLLVSSSDPANANNAPRTASTAQTQTLVSPAEKVLP